MYGNGQVYMRKLVVTPLQMNDILVYESTAFIKPTLVSVMFCLRGTINFNWAFIHIKKKGTNNELVLPIKLVVPAFEMLNSESILNNLNTFRLIAVFKDTYYDVYSWNPASDQAELGCSGVATFTKPKCVFDNPIMPQMTNPDLV